MDHFSTSNIPLANLLSELPFFNSSFPADVSPVQPLTHKSNLKFFDKLCFNPFELNDFENCKTLTDDNDYEAQHWGGINSHKSNYFTENSFADKLTSCSTHSSKTNLSFIHFNARSLNKHFDEIIGYIQNLQYKFSIIGFSESWLNPTTERLYSIPGYKPFPLSRDGKTGGGVILYVTDNITKCEINDSLSLREVNGNFESLFSRH